MLLKRPSASAISRTIAISSVLLALTGCGGGGSSSADGGTSSNSQLAASTNISTPQQTATVQSASLVWQSPTRNVDGSCADDIAGYRVSYGPTSGGSYTGNQTVYLSQGSVSCTQSGYDSQCGLSVYSCSSTVSGLQPGIWYFAVQALDNEGQRSGYSGEASKEII